VLGKVSEHERERGFTPMPGLGLRKKAARKDKRATKARGHP